MGPSDRTFRDAPRDTALRDTVARSGELVTFREALDSGRNLLVVGQPGVGKSHIARSLTATLRDDGCHVMSISGGLAIRTVHLGAVQSLTSPGMARSPDELFSNIELDLLRQAGDRSTVLFVDDIDLIDPASAALVRRLAASAISTIATVRSDAASDPSVLALWKDSLFVRVDVAAFDQDGTAEFVRSLLGEQVSARLQRSVFDLAGGNALFTRELIADGRMSGSIVTDGAAWDLVGELRSAQRVSDLFTARLESVATNVREALELIALAEELTLALAGELIDADRLEELESSGLILVAGDTVRVAHPLLGEVVRRETPSLRQNRLIGDLIAGMTQSASRTPHGVLRAVRWQLDRNDPVRADLAAMAAQTAISIFDGDTAVACARAALDPGSCMSHVMLGRALLVARRPTEAVEALEHAQRLATGDAETATAVVALADALIVATGDFDTVSQLLRTSLDSLAEPAARAMVSASLAYTSALLGDMRTALRYSDEMIDSDEIDDLARLHLLVIWTISASLSGWVDRTQERLDQALELATRYRHVMPAALDQLLVTQLVQDLADGQSAKALRLTLEQRQLAQREQRLTALWDVSLSQLATLIGKGRLSCDAGAAAVAGHKISDPLGLSALSMATNALALAACGEQAEAMSVHDLALADPKCGPRERVYLARARANVLALQGDLDAAVAAAVEGAAGAGDMHVWAGWALYDAVRFDRPGDVTEQLRSLADQAPVESLLALNHHCEALVAGDAVQLSKAAERLMLAGFLLSAAEAWAHASGQLLTDGDQCGSAVAALRAMVLFGECDSVRSLAVEQLDHPLTTREFDIARAAAAGEASQSIADQVFVSRRTVENHLQNVYRKLGINQRSELQPIFDVPVVRIPASLF